MYPWPCVYPLVSLSVCLSVCLSHAGIAPKWPNIRSREQDPIALVILFSDAKDFFRNSNGSPPAGALNFRSISRYISETNRKIVSKVNSALQLAITYASPLPETHMPYGITRCFLPPHLAEVRIPPLPPAEAGTRFSDPGGIQG